MSETTLERWKRLKPHFTCPRCDATSWNPNDIRERYCGRCHIFVAPPITLREGAPVDHAGVRTARKRAEEALRNNSNNSNNSNSSNSNAVAARHDDDVSNPFSSFPSFSSDPAPPTAPDPPSSIDPGGGSSGGGGASGDW